MTKDLIIQNIGLLKSHSTINYSIKTKKRVLQRNYFTLLFDSNAPLEESINED
jgi:serine O-acetyltransferase